MGKTKWGYHRRSRPLIPTVTTNFNHSPIPRQIIKKPYKNAYLPDFLLPDTPIRTLQDILRGKKKHRLNRQNRYQNEVRYGRYFGMMRL